MAKKGRRRTPPRNDGQAFEALVERIERALAPTGAVITRRDRIPDRDGGGLREIDLSIRQRIGLSEILIIVECRDRKRSDVTWIEQVASKRRSVRADRAIVVSSKRLGRSAIAKAQALDVEARICEKLRPEDFLGWFVRAQVEYVHGFISKLMVDVACAAGEDVRLHPELERALNDGLARCAVEDVPFLVTEEGARGMTPRELIGQAMQTGWAPPRKQAEVDAPETEVVVSPAGMFVETTAGRRRVTRVVLGFMGFLGRSEEVVFDRHRLEAPTLRLVADGVWTTPDKRQRLTMTLVSDPPTVGSHAAGGGGKD